MIMYVDNKKYQYKQHIFLMSTKNVRDSQSWYLFLPQHFISENIAQNEAFKNIVVK